MQIISFVSQKGGSGKTTIALHVAVAAEQKGHKVALIDIDPQASVTAWHEGRDADSPLLAQGNIADLPGLIDECRKSEIDLAIIDTAPHIDALDAAKVSDFLVIPCRPTILDLRAIAPSIDIAIQAKVPVAVVLSSCPAIRGFAEAAIVKEARQTLANDYEILVWSGQISQRVAYHYALIDGRAAQEFEPKGKSAQEISALWFWLGKELKKYD